MRDFRRMSWRRHVAVICVLVIFVSVNKLLHFPWRESTSSKKDATFLPSETLVSHSNHKQTPQADSMRDTNEMFYKIQNNKKLLYDGPHTVFDRPKDNANVHNEADKESNSGYLWDYSMYLTDFEDSDIQHTFINRHKYVYTLNNDVACNGNVFVVALVHSAPKKLDERQMIRNTWGSVRFYSGAIIVPMFLLGQVIEEDNTVQKSLEAESGEYKDIIQGNFVDSYRNLTSKNIMGLHWVQRYCNHTKFILKIDDDTMVNIYHLIKFLFQKSPDGNTNHFLYCSTYKNQGPRRDKSDKWYVPVEEYKYSKYPPYCEGFAYIMSYDVSKALYDASREVKPYWVDDVYVTGFLVLKVGIYHRNMERGHGYGLMEDEHIAKTVQSSMFILAKYAHMRKNWDRTWSDIKIVNKILN